MSLLRVHDLTAAQVRKCLGVRAALLGEDWRAANDKGEEALTQAIGWLARAGGWEGLLVPSLAHRQGTNLIVFPGNLTPPDSYLVAINGEQSPPHPAV